MDTVLTLVAGEGSVDGAVINAAIERLTQAGAVVGDVDWLAPDHACDLPFDALDPDVAEAVVRDTVKGTAVDVAAQPVAGRRKRLLVADLESTVIHNEMLDELAELVGCGAKVAAITAQAMNDEIDFCASIRARVELLAGQPVELLDRAWARITYDSGAATLVATCCAHGVTTALVSGGFHAFADRAAAALGFDHARANRLNLDGDALAGTVVEPILDRDAKQVALNELCATLDIEPHDAVAVGDGANDLALLSAAGLGVAYHAKPAVAGRARFRVDHGDLSTLLYFQGYRATEITSTA